MLAMVKNMVADCNDGCRLYITMFYDLKCRHEQLIVLKKYYLKKIMK